MLPRPVKANPHSATDGARRRWIRGLGPALGALALAAWGLAYFEDIDTPSTHSTFHYEMTRVLARAAGFSAADTELIVVADAAVDLGSFTGDATGSPTVQISGTSRFEEAQAKYFHFPRRNAANSEGLEYPGGRNTCLNFAGTDDPCGAVAEANELEAWAVYGTGSLSIAVPEAAVNRASLAPVQGRTLVALGIYLHSLADSYSHEKCGEVSHTRKHALSPPACTTEAWHKTMEYGAQAEGVSYTREAGYAMWQELKHFRAANALGGAPAWDDVQAHAFIDGWVVLNRAQDRQQNADDAYSGLGACTVTCSASAATVGAVGEALAFSGAAEATLCGANPELEWDFGDGSAHSTQQSPTHAYSAPGTYHWTLTVRAGGQSCSRSGQVTVTAPAVTRLYLVPSAAHLPGAGGTNWRTDVAVVNRNSSPVTLALTWIDHDSGATLTGAATLAAQATVEWRDVLVSVFEITSSDKRKGVLHVGSDLPLGITSRTYNQASATATYGQYYPALEVTEGITAGQVGLLPQIKKNSTFRTNVGVVNLGEATCTVLIRLFDPAGAQIGSTKSVSVEAKRWKQQDDIFGSVGAGTRDLAYATVEVQTGGGRAWAYASIVDGTTGDPTTIPLIVPR